ncbi:DUF903 domain-containing protein [Algoriphagus sp. H41]|uniref:DUF903 domain-containing protein n=1 Tax=Algoriphagus oliviformis TaxID=2811231 RepID=A0ABS3C3A8_9BACT|nr:DUF903 domain-containing protein [Algoriphagus oliviformis]MBN7811594.1 DUF903 domain-containing protein [Algoriphagus oliviformis]
MMRKLCLLPAFLILFSCEEISDITRVKGPCTIELVDGRTISTANDIEILESTGTVTYRDEDGKLWSLSEAEYTSYTCGN